MRMREAKEEEGREERRVEEERVGSEVAVTASEEEAEAEAGG